MTTHRAALAALLILAAAPATARPAPDRLAALLDGFEVTARHDGAVR